MTDRPSYIAYTIFTDEACTVVRRSVQFSGEKADELLAIFRSLKGFDDIAEGDKICGCRIDRIGSEEQPAASLAA